MGLSHNVAQGLCSLSDFVLCCGVNFFTSLYMQPTESDDNIMLTKNENDAALDLATNYISRCIAAFETNIAGIKKSIDKSRGDDIQYKRFVKQLHSVENERANLICILHSLRGRVDPLKLLSATDTLSDNIALQDSASAYINRQVLTLFMGRDLEELREPVTKVTVEDAYREYTRDKPKQDVV